MTHNGTIYSMCNTSGNGNSTSCGGDSEWPLERIVSMVVPVFFGIIGLIGLMGNALVIIGKCNANRLCSTTWIIQWPYIFSHNLIFSISEIVDFIFHSVRKISWIATLYFIISFSVVTANQQMRSTTNLLIINLAAADILFVIFCVPFTATDYVFTEWPFGDLWCKYVSFFTISTLEAAHHAEMFIFFPLTGTIHDCRDMPCKCVYVGSDVVRSIPSCCASSDIHVIANRTQCNIVSGHFHANGFFIHSDSLVGLNVHWWKNLLQSKWLLALSFEYFGWKLLNFTGKKPNSHSEAIKWSSFRFCLLKANLVI